jgi:hypothetical protein
MDGRIWRRALYVKGKRAAVASVKVDDDWT